MTAAERFERRRISGSAVKDIHSRGAGFCHTGFGVKDGEVTLHAEAMTPDRMQGLEFDVEMPPDERFHANETIDVACRLHHDGIEGVYEPEKLLSLAASIANARIRPVDGQAPEGRVIAFTQRTSTGGHTSPSIMFPSYFVPSIEAKALLEAWRSRQVARGRVVPPRLEITPEWFYAKNAAKVVNHHIVEAHDAIDMSAEINFDLVDRYLQWTHIKKITDFLPRLVIDDWVWCREAEHLDKVSNVILRHLEKKTPASEEELVANSNLMALLRIGSHHGDQNERRSRTYISWHLLIMRDIDFEGEGTEDPIINFNKRDESRFHALRRYLLRALMEVDGLDDFEVNPNRFDLMTKVNSDDAAYYPSDFIAGIQFGEWRARKDEIIRYLCDPAPCSIEGRDETSRQARQRIYDAKALLGVHWEEIRDPKVTKEDAQRLLVDRARQYFDEILVPCEAAMLAAYGNRLRRPRLSGLLQPWNLQWPWRPELRGAARFPATA
jgi:hypothetical protein